MTRTYLYILGWLLMWLTAVPVQAQNVAGEDEKVGETLPADTLVRDSLSLKWPQSAVHSIDRLLEADMFQTSQVGLMVYDLTADSVIYRHNERQMMRPASTMKLLTAIAAIDRLGGSYQTKTELCYTGHIANRTLEGDIYCVGGMDPLFNADDMSAFVESIRKMGVDTIRGHLYADKSMKDYDLLGEGWCWDDDNPTLSPLLISRKDIFLSRFVKRLNDMGIVVEAELDEGIKPGDAFCICHRFHTMDQVLLRMLKESDNLYAEAMFYQLAASSGARSATAKQARAIVMNLVRKLGLNPNSYRFADGSGLSLYNYVTAELEVAMLRYAYQNSNIMLHLKPALPIAGTDGTIRSRMRGPFTNDNVRAKTGTLTGVSSLAGFCTAANGHQLAFSIINNGLRHTNNAHAFQDKVCTELCRPN